MLLIWGTKNYGKVGEVDGEFAITRFGHLWFLPFIPLGTSWITAHHGRELSGHDRRLAWRSVVVGYLRPWAIVTIVGAGIAAIGSLGLAEVVVAGVAAGLALLSLVWSKQRDPREVRRARFNKLTLGTGCDPMAMPRDLAHHLHDQARQRWAKVAGTMTPEDVAARGAASAPQAAAAYSLLRMTARLDRGDTARRALRASEEILDRTAELSLTGSPYRDELPTPTETAADRAPPPAR